MVYFDHSFTCFLKYAKTFKRLDWIYIQIHHLGSHPGKWSFSVRSADKEKLFDDEPLWCDCVVTDLKKTHANVPFGRCHYIKPTQTWSTTLLGTNISPQKGTFEDDFPFPQVGYASSLEGIIRDILQNYHVILGKFMVSLRLRNSSTSCNPRSRWNAPWGRPQWRQRIHALRCNGSRWKSTTWMERVFKISLDFAMRSWVVVSICFVILTPNLGETSHFD